jgi:hypothetical protein
MLRRGVLVMLLAAGPALVWVAPAQATVPGSTLTGSTATVTTGNGINSLTISKTGGNLALNGEDDWDPAPGSQTLADAAGSTVIINGGTDIDIVSIGFAGDTFASSFEINGMGGTDFLTVYPGGTGADSVTITGNSLTGTNLAHLSWDQQLDQVNIRTGGGNDAVNVAATPSSPQVLVYAEGGDDTLTLANGTGLGTPGGTFRGGPGTDTVDYSGWTTPVTADLGKTAEFQADLSGADAVPPSANAATAFAVVEITDLATSHFNYEFDVQGLSAVDIITAHIHSGAAGSNGATLLTVGPGVDWTDPDLPAGTEPETRILNVTDGDITEPALRAGNTYADLHSLAGDLRGQLTLDPNDGYGGSSTGLTRVFTVENLVGGSSNDTFAGSVPANAFTCGGGQDSVTTGPGDTTDGCETVNGVTAPPPTAPVGSVSALKPKAKAKGKKVTIDTRATAVCPAGATAACTAAASATAKVGKKTLKLGKANVTIAAGQSSKITIKVSKRAAKKWRKAGKVKVTLTLTLTVPGGATVTETKTVKLKAPKPKKKK